MCTHLALAERAFCAMLDPGGSAEAYDAMFILARLGDVIANALCQAWV